MIIKKFSGLHADSFKKLFCDYYAELDCEDDPLHLFDEYVTADLNAALICAALCFDGDEAAGFIIYQTDDVINDWCFKEGCGDLREIYVRPSSRRKGLGRGLVRFAENELAFSGTEIIYTLPTEESEGFFSKLGYADAGEYCDELDNKVFVKNLS